MKKLFYFFCPLLVLLLLGLVFSVARSVEASEILFSNVTASTTTGVNVSRGGGFIEGDDIVAAGDYYVDRVDYYVGPIGSNERNYNHAFVVSDERQGGDAIATSTIGAFDLDDVYPSGSEWATFYFSPAIRLQDIATTTGEYVWFGIIRAETVPVLPNLGITHYTSGVDSYAWGLGHSGGFSLNDPVIAVWGVNASSTPEGSVNTRIISQDEPDNGDLTSDDIVSFQFDYYNNDTDDVPVTVAGVDVRDVTSAFQYAPLESDISASGQSSFSQILDLTEGHFHMWRPYLRNASSTRIIYGSWYSFDVVSYSGEFDPLDSDPDTATSTLSALALSKFFSQQGYLASKFPFAYFYDMAGIVGTLTTDDTEDSFPTLTLNLGTSSALSLGDMEFLSKDTIEMFAGSTMVSLFRTLMSFIIWLSFAFAVYTQVKHLIKH